MERQPRAIGFGGLDEAVDGFHDAVGRHRTVTVSENPSAPPLTLNPERPVPPSGVGGRGPRDKTPHITISIRDFPRAMPPITKSERPRYFPINLFDQPAFRRQQREDDLAG
jgi:hypothetical protein